MVAVSIFIVYDAVCAHQCNFCRASAAAIAAANAAAQINAKLGLAGSGSAPVNPMAGLTSMAGLSSMGFSATEIVEVPDNMVGLG